MKTHTTIRISVELRHKAKLLGINISEATENMLKSLVGMAEDPQYNMLEVEKELQSIQRKKEEIAIQESKLLSKKVAFEERINEEMQVELKESINMANAVKNSGLLAEYDKNGN